MYNFAIDEILICWDNLSNDINDLTLIKFFMIFQVISQSALMAVFQNQIVGWSCLKRIETFDNVGMGNSFLYSLLIL